MDGLASGGGDLDRLLRIELTHGCATHDQVAVALSGKPGDILLRGNAAVHHHQRVLGRLEGQQHFLQRFRLTDIAWEKA